MRSRQKISTARQQCRWGICGEGYEVNEVCTTYAKLFVVIIGIITFWILVFTFSLLYR